MEKISLQEEEYQGELELEDKRSCECLACQTARSVTGDKLVTSETDSREKCIFFCFSYENGEEDIFILPEEVAAKIPEGLTEATKGPLDFFHIKGDETEINPFSVKGYYGTIRISELTSIKIMSPSQLLSWAKENKE